MPSRINAEQVSTHNRQFGYAGDVSASEAWALLQEQPQAVLVDVRTPQEWQEIGVPELKEANKELFLVTWRTIAGPQAGAFFVDDMARLPIARDVPVLLICRSGGRSQAAAMALTAAGYSCCFNVAGGFEGQQGWKATQLPST